MPFWLFGQIIEWVSFFLHLAVSSVRFNALPRFSREIHFADWQA
jgi:hypothetical protein